MYITPLEKRRSHSYFPMRGWRKSKTRNGKQQSSSASQGDRDDYAAAGMQDPWSDPAALKALGLDPQDFAGGGRDDPQLLQELEELGWEGGDEDGSDVDLENLFAGEGSDEDLEELLAGGGEEEEEEEEEDEVDSELAGMEGDADVGLILIDPATEKAASAVAPAEKRNGREVQQSREDVAERLKTEALALFKAGDKDGAKEKLRASKELLHEVSLTRGLQTVQALSAPPEILPSTPPKPLSGCATRISGAEDLRAQAKELKVSALAMHKSGRKAEAITLLKRAKSIEERLEPQRLVRRNSASRAGSSSDGCSVRTDDDADARALPPSPPPSAAHDPPSPLKKDGFSNLTAAIRLGIESCTERARSLAHSDPAAAKASISARRELQSQLRKVQEVRMLPDAQPPSWKWQLVRRQRAKVIASVKPHEIQVEIIAVHGLPSLPSADVFVEYDLGYSKDDPSVCKGRTPWASIGDDGSAHFAYNCTHQIKREARSTQMAFRNRRASFCVVKKRKGWLTKEEKHGRSIEPLAPLLSSCEIESRSPLVSDARRAIGGGMDLTLRLRTPLTNSELVTTEEKELIIGQWPELGGSELQPVPVARPAPGLPAEMAQPVAQPAGAADFAILSQEEKDDPFSPNFIDSNAALEAEIKAAVDASSQDADAIFRLSCLQLKQQSLVNAIENEQLSLQRYIEILNERMQRDKVLALWLNAQGRKVEAVRVMKRIRVVSQELESAPADDEETSRTL
jgi:hypothetical protein